MRGFRLMGSYLLIALKREILFWHSENNIIEYVSAYGLHVFDFKNIGCHSLVHFYEACPESKNKKVLNMYNIFNLQKRHCE
jgi:hypothetical protein